MFPDAFIPFGQVPATASRLERAAGELRLRAGSPSAVPSLPVTLGHLEAAFDELGTCMRHFAEAAAEWSDPDDDTGEVRTLQPEARALIWHLHAVAGSLEEARNRCRGTTEWARRMLECRAAEPSPGAIMTVHRAFASPSGERASMRRIVCGVDGSEPARDAASAALSLAGRLGARLTLLHVTPTRTLVPADGFALGVDPSAYPRSADLAFSESEAAFNSLRPDVLCASTVREVRLGEPAVVLAEVAADCDAEMIVVGSRGRGAWRSAVLGSVSGELARLAACPVVIVPSAPRSKARPPKGRQTAA
jgi:nucleotide-binding universal stress UspA family protein